MANLPQDPEKAAELRAQLLEKVKAGWGSSVSSLLYKGADPNTRDDEGVPVLIRAVKEGDDEVIEALVAHGADPALAGPDGLDAAAVAAQHQGMTAVLQRAIGDRACDDLRAAFRKNDIDRVRDIIDSRALGELDEKRRNGWTPVKLAIAEHCVEGLALILEAGANPNGISGETKTALTEAMGGWDKKVQLAATLLEHGADPNRRDGQGNPPLLVAARDGNESLTMLLIKHGADVDVAGDRGNTALHEAAMAGQCEIVRLLAAAGADLYALNQSNSTPMDTALLYRRREAFETLVAAGGDPARAGHEGMTLLMTAAWVGDGISVERLAVAGVPLDAQREKDSFTALMFAAMNGKATAVRKLLELGANYDIVSEKGQTALDLAREAGHAHVEQIMKDHIANEVHRGLKKPATVSKAFKIVLGPRNAGL